MSLVHTGVVSVTKAPDCAGAGHLGCLKPATLALSDVETSQSRAGIVCDSTFLLCPQDNPRTCKTFQLRVHVGGHYWENPLPSTWADMPGLDRLSSIKNNKGKNAKLIKTVS